MKQTNKYFVFSDVHGELDALREALLAAGYDKNNPRHFLVSCGDAFDRGPKSVDIYRLLKERPKNTIAIKGNHDCFFQEYLEKGMDGEFVLFNILHNGLGATIQSFTGITENLFNPELVDKARKNIPGHVLEWFKNMPLYFETKNFIFCHAGINPNLENWKDTDEHYMLWDIEDSFQQIHNVHNKGVVIGHHHAFRVRNQMKEHGYKPQELGNFLYFLEPTEPRGIVSYGNTDEHAPVVNGNKIAIDGCTNYTKKVNVLVIEDYPKDDEEETITATKPNDPTPESIWFNDAEGMRVYSYATAGTTDTFTIRYRG